MSIYIFNGVGKGRGGLLFFFIIEFIKMSCWKIFSKMLEKCNKHHWNLNHPRRLCLLSWNNWRRKVQFLWKLCNHTFAYTNNEQLNEKIWSFFFYNNRVFFFIMFFNSLPNKYGEKSLQLGLYNVVTIKVLSFIIHVINWTYTGREIQVKGISRKAVGRKTKEKPQQQLL